MMDWHAEKTVHGSPSAVLRDGDKLIAKVYLSPEGDVLRVVLPEMTTAGQVKIDSAHHLIDFKRRPG